MVLIKRRYRILLVKRGGGALLTQSHVTEMRILVTRERFAEWSHVADPRRIIRISSI